MTAARLSYAAALEAAPDHLLALARLAAAAESQADHVAAAGAIARLAELARSPEERAGLWRKLADLASWISDPEAAARLLRPAAAQADAPLPVLLRLLEVERSRVGPKEIELRLALRIADVAAQADQPELARSVLVEQLDRVERPEETPLVQPLLDRALELAPRSAEVREVALRLARLAGDPTGLQIALKGSLEMSDGQAAPRRFEHWRELAALSLAAGMRGEAIIATEAMRALNPDDQGAALALVDLYRLEGRPDKQAEALDELSNLLWRTGDRAGAAHKLIALAELTQREDPGRAVETLRRAVALNPSSETLGATARLAESLGEVRLAAEVLEAWSQILEEPRAKAEALRRAAELTPDATKALELGLRSHDADPSYAWGQLVSAIQASDPMQAHDLAQSAWEGLEGEGAEASLSESERWAAEATAAAAARALGNAESEELWLSRLHERDQNALSYARRRLELLHELGARVPGSGADVARDRARDRATAMAGILERVGHRLSNEEAVSAFHELGSLRLEAGDPGASAAFQMALARDPTHGPSLIGLLKALPPDDASRPELRRRLLSALSGVDQSGLATPQDLGRLFSEEARSRSLEGPASRAAAQAAWREALELLPEDPEPARELARLWLESGDRRQAAASQVELAARLPDDSPELGAALLAAAEYFQRGSGEGAGATQGAPEAIAALEKGLTRRLPKATAMALWTRLADLHAQAGDQAGELVALERAAALAPLAERAILQLRRADRFAASGDREAERIALTMALPGREGDLELLRRLRAASEALGDDEAVADAIELAVQALLQHGDRPALPAAAYELGAFSRDRLRSSRRAEAAFRRTLDLAADHQGRVTGWPSC